MNRRLISVYRLMQPIRGGRIRRNEWGLTSRIRIRCSANLTNRHMARSCSSRSCRCTHTCPKRGSSTCSSRSVVLGLMQMPHFECIAKLRYSNCWRIEEIVCFRGNSNWLCLVQYMIGGKVEIGSPKFERSSSYWQGNID